MQHPAQSTAMNSPGSPDGPAQRPPRISKALAITGICWLLAILGAFVAMAAHSNSPGDPGSPPALWPRESGIPLDSHAPTLVLLAHPRCACTRASLGELELLMARVQGLVAAHVLFIRPAGTPETWAETDLWRTAAAIPGVAVHRDDLGEETRRFGSATSGQTLLFAPGGQLLFQGGITIARGHAGDNPGREALLALLLHGITPRQKTPVFGCGMFGCDSSPGVAKLQ